MQCCVNHITLLFLSLPLHSMPLLCPSHLPPVCLRFQTIYQLGVFLSRSSVNIIAVRHVWIFAVLQVGSLCTYVYTIIHTYVHAETACVYLCTDGCVCVCGVCVCVCVCVCVSVCVHCMGPPLLPCLPGC